MTDRVDGVVLTLDEAQYLVRALDELARLAATAGAALPARLDLLTGRLRKLANATQTQANASSNASDQWLEPDWGNHVGHGTTITPAAAARILGCTAANARGLAERGTIPAHKVGGRWRLDRAAVFARIAKHDDRPHLTGDPTWPTSSRPPPT